MWYQLWILYEIIPSVSAEIQVTARFFSYTLNLVVVFSLENLILYGLLCYTFPSIPHTAVPWLLFKKHFSGLVVVNIRIIYNTSWNFSVCFHVTYDLHTEITGNVLCNSELGNKSYEVNTSYTKSWHNYGCLKLNCPQNLWILCLSSNNLVYADLVYLGTWILCWCLDTESDNIT